MKEAAEGTEVSAVVGGEEAGGGAVQGRPQDRRREPREGLPRMEDGLRPLGDLRLRKGM